MKIIGTGRGSVVGLTANPPATGAMAAMRSPRANPSRNAMPAPLEKPTTKTRFGSTRKRIERSSSRRSTTAFM